MNFKGRFLWQVFCPSILVLVSAVAGVLGCGGGSKGTGGQTFDGRVLAVNTQPIPGVLITVNQSGDSAVSDSTGSFEIYTEPVSGPVSLALSTENFEGSVSLGDVPVGTARVTVTIELDEEAGEARAEGIEIEKEELEEDDGDPTPKPTRTPKPTPVPTSTKSPEVVPTPLTTPTPMDTETPEPTEIPDESEGGHGEHDGEGEDDGEDIEEEGRVQSISSSSLTVGDVVFEVNAQTVVVNKEESPISFSLLANGDSVHVTGVSINGHAVAKTIKVTRTKRRESEE